MKQWEYRWEHAYITDRPDDIVSLLNTMGKAGWEFCAITGNIMMFKREIVTLQSRWKVLFQPLLFFFIGIVYFVLFLMDKKPEHLIINHIWLTTAMTCFFIFTKPYTDKNKLL